MKLKNDYRQFLNGIWAGAFLSCVVKVQMSESAPIWMKIGLSIIYVAASLTYCINNGFFKQDE